MNGTNAGSSSRWDGVYAAKSPGEVSWHEAAPVVSARLVTTFAAPGPAVDVGAGASQLADVLVAQGFAVTVLDVSENALRPVRGRLGSEVTVVVGDVLEWKPAESFVVWHDRAVFHFLTDPADQSRYVELATSAVGRGGVVVLGTFAADGPTSCSGLPTARYDAPALQRLFADGFDLDHAEREEHVTPWGAIQPFTWVVLRRR